MGQKPLLAFAIALILASSGCLGFGDDELELQENDDDKQEPVGETNMTSLEKRIEHLESTIAEYEIPKVVFLKMSGYDYASGSYEYNVSNDGYLLCSYIDYYGRMSCNINAQYYDSNGLVTSYSWEASETSVNRSHYVGVACQFDVEPIICVSAAGSGSSLWTDVCKFGEVNQRLTLTVYDNDGNSASASYDLDYDAVCTVEEPDNTCASDSDCPPGTLCVGDVCVEDTSVCVDGDQMVDGGWTYTCVNGQWGPGEPVPDGTVCDDGDPYTENDAYYNGVCVGTPVVNHPPSINSLHFSPDPVTEETEFVCLQYDISDDDDDELEILVNWILDSDPKEELAADECFNLSNYPVQSGMKLEAAVEVWDGEAVAQDSYTVSIVEA
jgi:hypothetical protein